MEIVSKREVKDFDAQRSEFMKIKNIEREKKPTI